MGSRSNPVDVLEALSWHLNYHVGESLPVNQVAASTGLAWATVQKYAKVIETIQNIAPRIRYGSEGIRVGNQKKSMRDITNGTPTSVAVYLFVHAMQAEGSPSSPLSKSEHESFLGKIPETLEEMEAYGWIEQTESEVELTPLGVQISGPIYSTIQNGNLETDVVKVDRSGTDIRAVIESSVRELTSLSTSKGESEPKRETRRREVKEDFLKDDYSTEKLYA